MREVTLKASYRVFNASLYLSLIQTRLDELEQCFNTIYTKLELEKERSEVRANSVLCG